MTLTRLLVFASIWYWSPAIAVTSFLVLWIIALRKELRP